MARNKFYITTAIPYINARPHIGHAMEFIQGDVVARYHRLLGEDVHFLIGTDDNSLKNVQAAEKARIPVKEFVDKSAGVFQELAKVLNLSNDDFVRTVERRHIKAAQKLWKACEKDIFQKKYKGLYCVGCEEFKREGDLINECCPEHPNQELEEVEEENYFFKLSKYQDKLAKIIESDQYKITPKERKNEVLSFIRQGLEDFSISRSKERAHGWGIPVPGDNSQVIYVWFDALINYISALGYGTDQKLFKKYWPADVHIIGKGIIKFHAVYWPAMLLSAGVKLPKELFVHGYFTVNGQKMSKSLGNVVDPLELVQKYGSDPVRHFLLAEIPSYNDGDFSIKRFEERYNADLADGLGNLVARTLTMAEKYFDGKIPQVNEDPEKHPLRISKELYTWKDTYQDIDNALASFKFSEALAAVNKFIKTADKYIDNEKPWKLAKKDDKTELSWVLFGLLDSIHQIAWQIYPFMPETALEIARSLNIDGLLKTNPDIKDSFSNVRAGAKIKKPAPLFSRLEPK